MSYDGLDVASNPQGNANCILNAGYNYVGLYLRADRSSLACVQDLKSVGISIFSIWEQGYPTSAAYFTATQGTSDAEAACNFAASIQMPTQLTKPIFAAVDYDASMADLEGPILAYFTAFHDVCKSYGYLTGVYGSGQTCQYLLGQGYVHTTWLAQSTGWTGYDPSAGHAIVQGGETTVCGLDVDLDNVIDTTVAW